LYVCIFSFYTKSIINSCDAETRYIAFLPAHSHRTRCFA